MALPSSTTSSIGTGKTYTTVALWQADIDSATLDGNYNGEITGLAEDNSAVTFVTDPDGYTLTLTAASGQEADGTDTKGAQVDVTIIFNAEGSAGTFDINGIEWHTAAILSIQLDNASTICNITKNVFRAPTDQISINSNTADVAINIGVNLFRDATTSFNEAIRHNDATLTKVKVINNTFYNCDYGVSEVAGTFGDVRNNAACCSAIVALAHGVDYNGTPNNMSYCADSGDSTATGTGSINTLRDDGTDFTDTTNRATDASAFVPVSDGVLAGTGIAISGESWFPATDLAGTTWASPPSMGCFEVAAAGGWAHKFIGKASPGKANTIANASIGEIIGVAI